MIETFRRLFNYNSDTGSLTRKIKISGHNIGDEVGWTTEKGYRRAIVLGKSYYITTIIWAIIYGELVKDIDHRNGIRDDNRLDNLRKATRSQQLQNRQPNPNRLGFAGVAARGKRYIARINLDNKRINLGYFNTPEEAHKVYQAARLKYYGEYAKEHHEYRT